MLSGSFRILTTDGPYVVEFDITSGDMLMGALRPLGGYAAVDRMIRPDCWDVLARACFVLQQRGASVLHVDVRNHHKGEPPFDEVDFDLYGD